jgi:uncharacterized protein (DUF1499 family)
MNETFVLLLTLVVFGCAAARPASLGIADGRLSPCPNSPNCVSSQGPDKAHLIEPMRYETTEQQAKDRLVKVIQAMKRSKIITSSDHYIHAEFTSAFFRFIDDAEFYFDDTVKTIHMRSASRIGYSDFGVNRKRMEEVRSGFQNVSQVQDKK